MTSSSRADIWLAGSLAAEVGWLKAHVHVGRSYPLVAVRVCRRAAPGGGIIHALDSEDPMVLAASAYAIAFARALEAPAVRIAELDVDVSLLGAEPHTSLELRVLLDSTSRGNVCEEALSDLARRELAEAIAAGKWDLGENRSMRVSLQHTDDGPARQAVLASPPSPAAVVAPKPPAAVEPRAAEPSSSERVSAARAQAATDSIQPPASAPRRYQGAVALTAAVVVLGAAALGILKMNGGALPQADQQPLPAQAVAAAPPAPPATAPPPQPATTPAGQPANASSGVQAADAASADQPKSTALLSPPAAATLPPAQQPSAPTAVPQQLAPTAVPQEPTATAFEAQVAGARATPAAPTVSTQPSQSVLLDFTPDRASGLSWPNQRQGVGWFDTDGYHLAARNQGQFVAIGVLENQQVQDVQLSATFRKRGGPAGGGYGLVVADEGPGPRDGLNQHGNYVVFEVGDKGEVGVWRREDDQWVDIQAWTPSGAVRQGSGENTLALRVSGGEVAFSVNGSDVPLPPTFLAAGGIGLFLGGDANEAVLSRLTISKID